MALQEATKPTTSRPSGARDGELLLPLTEAIRSELKLDLRFVLRDNQRLPQLALLAKLNHTLERDPSRIRIPAELTAKLVREIDLVREDLPPNSPLLELRRRAGATPPVTAPGRVGAPVPAHPSPARSDKADEPLAPVRSQSEEAQMLRQAAADIEVKSVSTCELGDDALAAYLNYCLAMGHHDSIIGALTPRTEREPRVWIWNLLLTAMRMAGHPGLSAMAARFHAWMERYHPEVVLEGGERIDARRFSTTKMRVLEERELGRARA
jgi:hypothetical protein